MMTNAFFFDTLKYTSFNLKWWYFMKKLILFCSLILATFNVQAKITTLFFDIEAIFHTNSMRASSYVGKIDSLRYLSAVGHLPNQEDLFKQLKSVKAKSTQITYNNNLEMPLIFSDWLTAAQSNHKLKEIIQKSFANKNISDIEKKVLLAVVSMMMTPQHLADTQEVSSKIEKLLEKLKTCNIKLFLVGNWAHIASLKTEFAHIFRLFDGVFVSGDLHVLKPMHEYYDMVLEKSDTVADHALWIETEQKFITRAKSYGLQVTSYHHDHHDELVKALRSHGLSV
jgi:FMN phosphatase YigB (HAD superfamily)